MIQLIFQTAVSNKAHPEYGQATIPLPIPDSEYDQTIELLEGLDIGSPTGQDCRVDFLDSRYPILNRLVTQSVNVDELDYLAKRLESFCSGEAAEFQAMASKMCLSDIQDFINLTFCCQQATVITDFSDLERVGKAHSLTTNGGSMPMEELDRVDGQAVALDLIQNGGGIVTSYGVVYDNGMELEQIYTGGPFPQYLYEAPLLTLGVPIRPEIGGPAQPVPLPRLIDMVYSTDRCHFVEEATDDYTLGRFCAENSFVPEADDLSDEAFELLDFARIGREFRQNEGGVFTSGGYVQKHDELRQMYDNLELTLKKPDLTAIARTCP